MTEEHTNTYLWDRSGEPDAEIQRLETVLGRFRYDEPMRLPWPEPRSVRLRWWSFGLATAAAVAMFMVFFGLDTYLWIAKPGREWNVARLSGTTLPEKGKLVIGGLIETDGASRALLQVGWLGRVEVMPNSLVRLVETRTKRHRLHLERGKIAARLWAPPFTFAVDTPLMTAFDMGCAFTLEILESGTGILRVTSGWVQVELDDREELVPAGAVAEARRGLGPGLPYYEDSSPAFQAALHRISFDSMTAEERETALNQALTEARRRDVMSLFRLLLRVSASERPRIVDRAALLLPPPPQTTRAGLIRGDAVMMNQWWNELGLPHVKQWWINWRDVFPE